jgi:hypothetical protein
MAGGLLCNPSEPVGTHWNSVKKWLSGDQQNTGKGPEKAGVPFKGLRNLGPPGGPVEPMVLSGTCKVCLSGAQGLKPNKETYKNPGRSLSVTKCSE